MESALKDIQNQKGYWKKTCTSYSGFSFMARKGVPWSKKQKNPKWESCSPRDFRTESFSSLRHFESLIPVLHRIAELHSNTPLSLVLVKNCERDLHRTTTQASSILIFVAAAFSTEIGEDVHQGTERNQIHCARKNSFIWWGGERGIFV